MIPKLLFQTNITRPDTYVLNMILSKINSAWKYEFYNDADVIQFFIDNPLADLPDIIQKYNSFKKGCHKADLFRYYFLYINGGVFMDSDAMLYVDIDNIVGKFQFVSVNSSVHPGKIYQGVLGASPNNEIIKRALYDAYNTNPAVLEIDYHYFCKILYDIVTANDFGYNIKLYKEANADGSTIDIVDGTTVLFKHFWKYKIIPENKTQHTNDFTKIYDQKCWISGSGCGSNVANTAIYNKYIIDFIRKNNITSVTDVGCGDWQSTHLIYQQIDYIDYVGLDCVESVIETNKEKHHKYDFYQLDILCDVDIIRDSDLYIVKDVLQHWKLENIYNFLDKLVTKKFKYIIITNNGDQMYDNSELYSIVSGRGLNSKFLPLKKYNAELLLEYFGGENKHMCIIRKENCFIQQTEWNNYNKSEINNFDFRILNTYTIPNMLVRVGRGSDGGYVIADGFEYDLLISCGIANDISFEESFLDIHKIKCLAFDGTIKSFPSHKNDMTWIPKNVGYSNTVKTTNLKEYMQNNEKIFLKMDIEGSEFNWLDSMTENELGKFSQIVIEIHWPFDIYRMNMLKKLNATHYIAHIHGNNYCDKDIPKNLPSGRTYDGTVTINKSTLPQIKLPEVFEVTFINKKLLNNALVEIKEIHFPTILDYPNNPNAPDIHFSIPVIDSDVLEN